MTCLTEFYHWAILFIAHNTISGYFRLRFDAFGGMKISMNCRKLSYLLVLLT
jgi:hypothetical protein